MKTVHIKVVWNEAREQWDIRSVFADLHIQEFVFNCGTIHNIFEGLDKQIVNRFKLEVTNEHNSES